MCGCTHTVNKAHVPKLRENTALIGLPSDSAQSSRNLGWKGKISSPESAMPLLLPETDPELNAVSNQN